MPTNANYAIRAGLSLVRDQNSIAFRVKHGDYFGTAATIISLLRQHASGYCRYQAVLKGLEDDLQVLQDDYRITKK